MRGNVSRALGEASPAPTLGARRTRASRLAIRFLLQLLIALLLAVTLAAAGYSLLLALRREPVGRGDPATLTRIPSLPEPSRLPRRNSYLPASLPTDHCALTRPQRALAIEIRDLPPAWRTTAGVAVFDDADLQCAWVTLAGRPMQNGALHLEVEVPAATPLRVTVAAAEALARHGYWLRTAVAADAAVDTPLALDVPVQAITVRAHGVAASLADAMRLRRTDDPDWVSLGAFAETSATDARGDLHLLLGPGRYELAPWTNGSWNPVPIVVPGPKIVTVWFER